MPPGPTSSNSDFAIAAPNCTDAIPANTRSVGCIRSSRSMARDRTQGRERSYEELERVFADVDAPFAFVDLDAMWSNASEMLERAAGTPIRVASKSVRCRALLASILGEPGFRGLMTFTLPESLWLHEHGFDDLLLAYPTAHRGALADLGRLDSERPPILMVDSVAHLDLIESAVGRAARPVRVCIDLDVSWWPLGGRLKIGVKRSPIRTPEQARELAHEIVRRPGLELAGLMGYEAHIAGLGDSPLGKRVQAPLIRQIKRLSASEIAESRARRGGGRERGGPAPARERRRHREHPHDAPRGRDHGDHRGLGSLRANLVRPLFLLQPHPRRDVRHARRAQAERLHGHAPGRRLSRVGRGGARSPARTAPPAEGSVLTPWKGQARCKLPCWGLPPLACKSAQTSICAMRRPGSCASVSTPSIWCAAAR